MVRHHEILSTTPDQLTPVWRFGLKGLAIGTAFYGFCHGRLYYGDHWSYLAFQRKSTLPFFRILSGRRLREYLLTP